MLVDKPLHWTSFDVVNKLRYTIKRTFGLKKVKVGHAGTLDPLATGLLLVCAGKATKRADELQAEEKEYQRAKKRNKKQARRKGNLGESLEVADA